MGFLLVLLPGILWGAVDVYLGHMLLVGGFAKTPAILLGVSVAFHLLVMWWGFFKYHGPAEAGLGPAMLTLYNAASYFAALVVTTLVFWVL